MELSREIIIDVVLNIAGYVTAGALWLVLWSLFSDRSKAPVQTSPLQTVPPMRERTVGESSGERRAEFISLKADATYADAEVQERDRLRAEATRYQRNRAEVIRIARSMLQSGSSKDKVRSLLPISDGELALLANE